MGNNIVKISGTSVRLDPVGFAEDAKKVFGSKGLIIKRMKEVVSDRETIKEIIEDNIEDGSDKEVIAELQKIKAQLEGVFNIQNSIVRSYKKMKTVKLSSGKNEAIDLDKIKDEKAHLLVKGRAKNLKDNINKMFGYKVYCNPNRNGDPEVLLLDTLKDGEKIKTSLTKMLEEIESIIENNKSATLDGLLKLEFKPPVLNVAYKSELSDLKEIPNPTEDDLKRVKNLTDLTKNLEFNFQANILDPYMKLIRTLSKALSGKKKVSYDPDDVKNFNMICRKSSRKLIKGCVELRNMIVALNKNEGLSEDSKEDLDRLTESAKKQEKFFKQIQNFN